MKRIYGIIAALILAVAGISGAVYLGTQNYEVYLVLENEGVAVTDDSITRNLLQSEDSADVSGKMYEMSETVYVKGSRLFLGEEKEALSSAYPLFVNAGSTLYCLSDSITAITEDFESVPTYQGLYVSEGISFNQDMERAYRESFLFLQLTNGLYMNAMDMDIQASALLGKKIENNAVMRFEEEKISWYALEEDVFVYGEVTGLDENSVVTMNETYYTYYELLELLGMYSHELQEVTLTPTMEPAITPGQTEPMDEPTPTATFTPTPTPTSTPTLTPEAGKDETGEPGVVTRPSVTPSPTAIPQEDESDNQQPKPTKVPSDREWNGEESDVPLLTPMAPLPALPAEEVEEVETVENLPFYFQSTPSTPQSPSTSQKIQWKVPKVTLGEFSAQVYTIYNKIESIENSEFIHKKGIVYQVFELSGEGDEQKAKLVTQRAVKTQGEIKISGLRPDTKYKVVVTLNYRTGTGYESEILTKEDVILTTKAMSELPKAEMNFAVDGIYENKAKIKDIGIRNYQELAGVAYEDMFTNIKKVALIFQKDGKEVVARLSADQLADFKLGEKITYETGTVLESNSKYALRIAVYDGKDNEMTCWEQNTGIVYTSKAAPKANIKLEKNEVKDVVVKIDIENEDKAAFKPTADSGNTVYFAVYYRDGEEPIETAIQRKEGLLDFSPEKETGIIHSLDPKKTTEIRFENLLDYEAYTIKVFAEYNTDNDELKEQVAEYTLGEIGSSRIVTAPLSTLGYAFFRVTLNDVTYNKANISIKLDETRTDERLLGLLSYCKIDILPEDGTGAENIRICYKDMDAEETPDAAEGEALKEVIGGSLVLDSKKAMSALKEGLSFALSGLESKTSYSLSITPVVMMGDGVYQKETEINASFAPKSFATLKKPATVAIGSSICMSNSITFKDVEILDADDSIVNGPVYMYAFDMYGNNVFSYVIPIDTVVPEIFLDNLNSYHLYTFRFYANEVNLATDEYDKTHTQKRQEIFYEELAEEEQILELRTGEGLSGRLDLKSIETEAIRAKYDIRADQLTIKDDKGVWKRGTNSKTQYAKASGVKYPNLYRARDAYKTIAYEDVFKIEYDFGAEGCNSFSVGYANNGTVNTAVEYAIYKEDPSENPDAVPLAVTKKGKTTDGWMYTYWTEEVGFRDNEVLKGVQTLYLRQTNAAGANGFTGLIAVRFYKRATTNPGTYAAQLQVTLDDVRKELGDNPVYYIRVYEKESNGEYWFADYQMHTFENNGQAEKELQIYRVKDVETPQLLETIPFTAADSKCVVTFNYAVNAKREYRFELVAGVDGYVVSLGEVELKTGSALRTIETFEDLLGIRQDPSADYMVVSDIEIPKGWTSAVLSDKYPFRGSINFQGHTLTKNHHVYLFHTMAANSLLENLYVRYADDYTAVPTLYAQHLIYYNYGTIRNLMFEYNLDTEQPNANLANAGNHIIYCNQWGGVIENFVLHLKNKMQFRRYGGMVYTNRGIIRNGYVYGEPLQMISRYEYANESDFLLYRSVGPVTSYNTGAGVVENCYTSVDVYSVKNTDVYNGGSALLAGEMEGKIHNNFATGTVYAYDTSGTGTDIYLLQTDMNPLFDHSKHGPSAKMQNNHYYEPAKQITYDGAAEGTKKMQLQSLYDAQWYDTLFNKSDSSVKDQFRVEMATLGFYPHVDMPECMPKQEWVPLPEWNPAPELNLVHAAIREQGANEAKVTFTFDNADSAQVTDIHVKHLNVRIDRQYMEDGLWRVEATVSPSLTDEGYYSLYKITGFSARYNNGGILSKSYQESDYRELPVEFYKSVKTAEDWKGINSNRAQNYRLDHDIDFSIYSPDYFVVTGTFSGKLDGNGYEISNLRINEDVSKTLTYSYIFNQVSGSIKNLRVKNLEIKDTDKNLTGNRGFIGSITGPVELENIHIDGAVFVSSYYTGTLVATTSSSNAPIRNCSVKNVTITSTARGNRTQAVGGLIGLTGSTGVVNVENCFVDNLNIRIEEAYTCSGVGGIIGVMTTGSSVKYCYVVNSTIYSEFQCTGGIIGVVAPNTYFTVSTYAMDHVVVDAQISSSTDNLGGFVGYTRSANDSQEIYGLFLGSVYSTNKSDVPEGSYLKVRAFEGCSDYGTKTLSKPAKLYMSKTASVNGAVFDPAAAAKTDWYKEAIGVEPEQSYTYEDFIYYSYEELCNPSNYGEFGIDLGGQFRYDEVADGILPKLKWLSVAEDEKSEEEFRKQQSDYYYRDDKVVVTGITKAENNQIQVDEALYDISVTISHPEGTVVSNVLTDANHGIYLNSLKIDRSKADKTVITYTTDYKAYVDRYFITGYEFTLSGASGVSSVAVMLDTTIEPRYLSIGSASEWNQQMGTLGGALKKHNIRITGNIDFTSEGVTNAARNAKVNQLVGAVGADKMPLYTISGINLSDASFIAYAYGDVKNLNFKDVKIIRTGNETTEKQYMNLIGVAKANVTNLNISNLAIDGYRTVKNGIIGEIFGTIDGITMDGVTIKVHTKSSNIGGLVGYVNNLAYVKNVEASNIVVFNDGDGNYTGGIVGYEAGASHIISAHIENFLVYGHSYVGGIAGYAEITTYGLYSKDMHATNGGVFAKNHYAGGIFGYGRVNSSTVTTTNLVDNVFVSAKGSYAGGAYGRGCTISATTVQNSVVAAAGNDIGGLVGRGQASYSGGLKCLDTIVTTLYARSTADAEDNDIYKDLYEKQVNKVKALLPAEGEAVTAEQKYAKTACELVYENTAKWNPDSWKTAPAEAKYSSNIGGIIGAGNAQYAIVANCEVGAVFAKKVGGIIGVQEYVHNVDAPVNNCGVQGGSVTGYSVVGGIVGDSKLGTIRDCYSATEVKAVEVNDKGGNYAGGIVGQLHPENSASYPSRVEYVFSTSDVTAYDYAGGIVGYADQQLRSDNRRYLFAGNVTATKTSGIKKQIGNLAKGGEFKETYIYPEVTDTGSNAVKVTAAELKGESFYKSKLSFSTKHWSFNGLANGWMPYIQYNTNTRLAGQEGYIEVDGVKTYNYKSNNGGVQIPGLTSNASNGMMFSIRRPVKAATELPTLTAAYSAEVDKLNLEFSSAAEAVMLKIEANGQVIAELPMTKRCYTLSYDYRTDLKLTLSYADQQKEYEVLAQNMARNIMVWKENYFYIAGMGIEGSRATIAGSFVHLYEGKALAANGDIYDVVQGTVCGKAAGVSLLAETIPFRSAQYEGSTIDTYYGYSVVDGAVRDEMRLYVKGQSLFAVAPKLTEDYDAILLDTAEDGELTTVLYRGTIKDLTDVGIAMPKEFENSDIWQMTNNLDSDRCYVLVRYADGAVAGFNYMTGDELPIDTVRVYGTNTDSAETQEKTDGTNFAAAYEKAKEFEANLIGSGWTPPEEALEEEETKDTEAQESIVEEQQEVTVADMTEQSAVSWPVPVPTWPVTPTPLPEGTEYAKSSESEAESGKQDSYLSGVTEEMQEYVPVEKEESGTVSGSGDAPEGAGSEDGTGETGEISGTDNKTTEGGSVGGGTLSEAENAGKADADKDPVVQETTEETSKKKEPSGSYIPYFDPELGEYVIFDEAELLSKSEEKPVSMNEQVRRSGHMIEKYSPFMAESIQNNQDNRLGVGLFSITLLVVAALIVMLMIKQKPDGVKHEEN